MGIQMAKRSIEDGFLDCPKFGLIDQMRCIPSCESHEAKDDDTVTCYFGEERPAPAQDEAETPSDQEDQTTADEA